MTIERDIVGGGEYDPGTGDIAPYKVADQQQAIVAIGGLIPAANKLAYFDSSTTAALTDFTSVARALVGAITAAAMRIVLGLGNIDNTADNVKDVASAAVLHTARKINGVSFDGSADISGGAITTKSATFTLAANEYTILCDATAGAIIANLPAATGNVGRIINIKKIDASINTITVDGNASETIDGATTIVILSQWSNVTMQCDGTAWFIL